jgi:branched-chain amino acid transport system permease protein
MFKSRNLIFAVIIVGLVVPIILGNPFWSLSLARIVGTVAFTVAVWALLEVGGQPAFGVSAFAGIAVYTYALTTKFGHVSPWLAIVLGLAAATVAGSLLALPSMRIGGIMTQGILNIFFISAFASIIAGAVKWTGGTAGVSLKAITPESFFAQLPYKYMLVLIFSLITILGVGILLQTRFGKILALAGKNERLASSLGIDVKKYKRLAYVVFVPLIALGGLSTALSAGVTGPVSWSVELAFTTILAFWIGGSRTIWGPIVGAALVASIPTLLNAALEWRIVAIGVVALLIRMYAPQGIVGLGASGFEAVFRRPARGVQAKPDADDGENQEEDETACDSSGAQATSTS